MKVLLSTITIVAALWLTTIEGKECYWRGWPTCGLLPRCGDDHFMWYKLRGVCLVGPDKYCCPAGRGDDIVLCQHKDLYGDCTVSSLETACVTVDNNDWASSINTLGKCFRLYEHDHCTGRSVAVYPGSKSHNNLEDLGMNDMVSSVGKCFDHDKYQECSGRSKRSSRSKRYIPPSKHCSLAIDIMTIGFLAWRRRDTSNLNSPVRFYQQHPNNGRTEAMEAFISRADLDTGTATNRAAQQYAQTMGRSSDHAGHILATRLGGSGRDLRNIFPQNPNFNQGAWAQVEEQVAQVVTLYGSAIFNVNLEYVSESATRPHNIVFRIARGDTGEIIVINDMLNP